MIIICAKLFSNPTMHNEVMCRTRTGFTEVYVQSLSADCDLYLDLATWFLFATYPLVMMIICAKLFSNPKCIRKLGVGQERVSLKSMHKV